MLGPLTDGNCGICGGSQGIHQYETWKCPLHGKEARIGEKQVWLESTFINADYGRIQDAAPDLLEACKKALELFRNKESILVHGCDKEFTNEPCTCGLNEIQQAIAKAEGK